MSSRRNAPACFCPFPVAFAAAMPACAADYDAGKSIDLLVGAPPGGGYDIYGRLVGRHFGGTFPATPPSW